LSAFEDLRQNNEAAKGLSVAVLTRKLGSEGSVKSWNAQVDQHFDDVWTEEENVQRDSRAKKKGAKNEKRKEKAEPAGEVGSRRAIGRRWSPAECWSNAARRRGKSGAETGEGKASAGQAVGPATGRRGSCRQADCKTGEI